VETLAFRPGRKRRFTSPEMSAPSDSVFACPGTGSTPHPPRKRYCGTTAPTPGTFWNLVSAALSTGQLLHCPALTAREQARLRRLQRTLARATRGSKRRGRARHAIARETDRRKDWAEQASTVIARRFDLIRVEDLKITNMTRSAKGSRESPGRNVRAKAGLNRGILASGWGLLVGRLQDKAPGRVEKINPAFTSQRCSACGRVDRGSRESQAVFRCTACGFAVNADVNAAINIAAGHAVTARGGDVVTRPVNREPQLLLPSV
jgi:putative transposase